MIKGNVELYNFQEAVSCENSSDHKLCRIPDELRLKLNKLAQITAFSACSSEIRFKLKGDSGKITLKIMNAQEQPEGYAAAEIYHGCFQEPSVRIIGGQPTVLEIKKPDNIELLESITKAKKLPFDPNIVRIILPYGAHMCFISAEGDITPPEPCMVPETRWLAYGSSITHGASAMNPAGSYAVKTAAKLGVDLINLGFAGSAMLEAPMADYIAEREDWNFATLEMGINMIWDMEQWKPGSIELFKERVDYFVSRIAEAHPDKWIFCIDMFTVGSDFNGSRLHDDFRNVIKEKVERLNMLKVKYICGRELIEDYRGLASDMIHPSQEGMEEISVKLSRIIKETVRGNNNYGN